jgi:oligoendopeptidase F
MLTFPKSLFLAAILTAGTIVPCRPSSILPRAELAIHETWQLEDIYPSKEAWSDHKTEVINQFDQIPEFKGTLTSSARRLLQFLNLRYQISKDLSRLGSYAAMRSDQDTRDPEALEMKQEIARIRTEFSALESFAEPEILSLTPETLAEYMETETGLEDYRMYLDRLLRTRTHILSPAEERILAEAGNLADAPRAINNILRNAELPYPEITLSNGQRVLLNQQGYSLHRASPVREDREAVFQAFYSTLDQFEGTFGAQMYANLRQDFFYTRMRNYASTLKRSLDWNDIPIEVYHALIENVHANLDTFHRYLRLKQRMLGVSQLHYHDLYAPVLPDLDITYTVDEAKALILEALKPLGPEYVATVARAFNERWIDFHPNIGKRSGAYSNGGVYDVHPYILMNFNGRYVDVGTLAHELGHTLHSFLSNHKQPYPLARYSTFVAEVASTLNEALLMDHVLDTIEDDQQRLAILMNYLDEIKGTVFRQTQFAEFELRMHQVIENGGTLTGEKLTSLYSEITRKYYGHDEGVCIVDDEIGIEWAFIPHFFSSFYVFQYATSFTASTALAAEILDGEPGARDRYLEFLSAGGSQYPVELLKEVDVDLTTGGPFNQTISSMNRAMDEMEAILAH